MFRSSLHLDNLKSPSRSNNNSTQSLCDKTNYPVNSKYYVDKYTVGYRSDMSCPIAGNPTYLSYTKIQPKLNNLSIPFSTLKKEISGGSLPSEFLNNWYNTKYPQNPLH